MKIFNICDNLSISVVKYVQLQQMAGIETITAYNRCGIMKFASPRCGIMFKPNNLETLTHFADSCDAVMVHTSTMSVGLLDIKTKRPIIWACHDYVKGYEPFVNKIKACAVSSNGYKIALRKEPFPTTVIHRKVAGRDWPAWSKQRINCTIMPGVVSNDDRTPYRDYTEALKLLDGRLIIQSAVLPSRMSDQYMVMETVEPHVMMQRMAMFDTAWVGCGSTTTNFDIIINNKLHESIASGAVPILHRSQEMSGYADTFKCGITWSNQYPKQDQIASIRRNIQQNKLIHCLESELPNLKLLLSSL